MKKKFIKQFIAFLLLAVFAGINLHFVIEHAHEDHYEGSHCHGHDHGHEHEGTFYCSLDVAIHNCEMCHWLQNADLTTDSDSNLKITSSANAYTENISNTPSLISVRYYDSRGPPTVNS